jgi:hypothetical protein
LLPESQKKKVDKAIKDLKGRKKAKHQYGIEACEEISYYLGIHLRKQTDRKLKITTQPQLIDQNLSDFDIDERSRIKPTSAASIRMISTYRSSCKGGFSYVFGYEC